MANVPWLMPADPALVTGPSADASSATFRVADPDRSLQAVRLWQEVRVPGECLGFVRTADQWTLRLDRPLVDRMEYLFELTGLDGGSQNVLDPANPLWAPGAFGPKSVLEFPEYVAPRWLSGETRGGTYRSIAVRAASLKASLDVRVWAPAGALDAQALPLLVVHDGPEYDELASLTRYLAVLIDGAELPPLRAALLPPGPRDDWYSANSGYGRALQAVIRRLRDVLPTTATVGMGTSLGGLAMLHAQRAHPGLVDALFLQSGSYFQPRYDSQERRFPHYRRIVRAVEEILRSDGHAAPVPAVLTCGGIEENAGNNRMMARTLATQGYDVALHEVRDVHNYTAWRDAFDPHLTGLLRAMTA